MLSLLIPVYNFDVRPFVAELHDQAIKSGTPFEIICLDDMSESSYRQMNREVSNHPYVTYREQDVKADRAGARNKLFHLAKYEWLLFLDCDGECADALFIQRYISAITGNDGKVFYGGRLYELQPPSDHELYFHWYIGSNKEVASVKERAENPHASFMTNNFLVHREVYVQILMDSTIKGYGHEDTFFAQELKRGGVPIKHIPNPLYHLGIEPASVFIEKSRQGVRNLAILYRSGKVDRSVKLIAAYEKLRGTGMATLLKTYVLLREKSFLDNFCGKSPSLWKFDLWKLALFIREVTKKDAH